MESVTRFIEQNFGLSFLVGVIVVGTVISGIVWITIWAVKLTNKHKDVSKRIEDLPCPHHTSKIERHDEQFADSRAAVSRIEGQLDLLVKTLVPKQKKRIDRAAPTFSGKHSPRQLNANGIALLKDSGADVFLESNIDLFIKKMEIISPKTAYDVEDLASTVLLAESNNDIFIPLKSWVYNAPTRKLENADGSIKMQDVELDDIIFVMSLPLRDKYLELHPEIIK